MRVHSTRLAFFACAAIALAANAGCTSVLGFEEFGVLADASTDAMVGPEISAPPPPPAPGKASMGLTSGGNVSTSVHYTLVAAVGESPGGNVVSKSASYTMNGGVVGAAH